MNKDDNEDLRPYFVVVNDEEQFSVWLADRPIPGGWRSVGSPSTRKECLDRIAVLWTDMRPLSVRKWMEGNAPNSKPVKPGTQA